MSVWLVPRDRRDGRTITGGRTSLVAAVAGVDRSAELGQRLRPLSCDDDRAAGDRHRGQRRRRHVEGTGVPVEAGGSETAAASRRSRTCRGSTGRCGSRRWTRPQRSSGCGHCSTACSLANRPSCDCSRRIRCNGPPRFARLAYYQYHFTSKQERAETGAWWKREFEGYLTDVVKRSD